MSRQFIIAAPSSNAGKTTFTLGLLRLFQRQGIPVQPFKIGPDYIDPKFHELASGKVGVNIDLFMMTQQEINDSLHSYGQHAQINCIEGVMGLFDGANKDQGSTAEMAKKLQTPVLMVIDAKAVGYTVAPLIQGFVNFDQKVQIMGVVFNRVGSERHYSILKEACDDIGVACFGYLRHLENSAIPSRHLGLNIQEITKFDTLIDHIATELDKTVDWNAIVAASKTMEPTAVAVKKTTAPKTIKFAVAKDEAFNFIYPQHISAMEELGAITYFSPLHDTKIPDSDFAYFPGGYPEAYLDTLSSNTQMRVSIKKFAQNNGQIYAECGGMMYLGKAIIAENNNTFEMVNYFDFVSSMAQKKLHLGYRTSPINHHIFKGHEFHYSRVVHDHETTMDVTITNARGGDTPTKIYKKNNVMGSYVHHYFGTSATLLQLINAINK